MTEEEFSAAGVNRSGSILPSDVVCAGGANSFQAGGSTDSRYGEWRRKRRGEMEGC